MLKKIIYISILALFAGQVFAYTTPVSQCGWSSSATVQYSQCNINSSADCSTLEVPYTATGVTEQVGLSTSCYAYTATLTGCNSYRFCFKNTTPEPDVEKCWSVESFATCPDVLTSSRGTGTALDAAGVRGAVGLASANLDTQIADIPTVTEFEARTQLSADYFDPATDTVANVTTVGSVTGGALESTLTSIKGSGFNTLTDSLKAIKDRTLLLSTFQPDVDVVAHVTLVDTTTTNTDMRGTDGAYTGNPPTVAQIRTEMDNNSTQLAALIEDTGTTLPGILATAQADLDNPAQYKADTSLLALEATSQSVKSKTDQLIFVAGKVDANATVSLDPQDLVDIAAAVVAGIDLDTIWDALKTAHTTANSFGSIMGKLTFDSSNYVKSTPQTAVNVNTAQLTAGVLQHSITVTDNTGQTITRGDAKPLTFNLGTSWPLTGKRVFFIMKADPTAANSTAKVNRECTVTDAVNGVATITLTTTETNTIGRYYGEVEVRNTDNSSPLTALQFTVKVAQDIRQ